MAIGTALGIISLLLALASAGAETAKGIKEADYEKKSEKYRKKQEADLKKQMAFRRKEALRAAIESRKPQQIYRPVAGSRPWEAPKQPSVSTENIIGGTAGALGSLSGGLSGLDEEYNIF